MSELYAITITGIVASDIGDPADSWTDASLPDLVRTLFDRDVVSTLFATHHNGRIVVEYSKPSESSSPIPDPDNIINDALDDANGFYEMFEGYEGVEERVERLHQAMQLMNTPTSVITPISRDMTYGMSPEAKEELHKAFAKVRPDLYPAGPEGILTCIECGEKVERTHSLQKYCDETCRKSRNARVAREAKEVKS